MALVYPDAFSIWHFHRDLLRALVAEGHEVYAISRPTEHVSSIERLGVVHIGVSFSRFMSPVQDLRLMWALFRTFRRHRFDIVHNFTIKPNIYGAIAARLAGVRRVIGTAEGLGLMFADGKGPRFRLVRSVVHLLYRIACRLSDRVWFVNPDDRERFVREGLIQHGKTFLTISAGVNVSEFRPNARDLAEAQVLKESLGLSGHTVVLMVVGRVIWSKGVREFCDAALLVRERRADLKFVLVGPQEVDNPDSVPLDYLEEVNRRPNFCWLAFRDEVRPVYLMADLVVLPSFYHEGVPNVLLEAMALGKPIVTTWSVGCKEVVDDGENGFLVPPRNPEALVQAIERCLASRDTMAAFGRHSRRKAEQQFDKAAIVSRVLAELYAT